MSAIVLDITCASLLTRTLPNKFTILNNTKANNERSDEEMKRETVHRLQINKKNPLSYRVVIQLCILNDP